MSKRWRSGNLQRAIPITRGDLDQGIARVGYRPEHNPKPGKDRWFSWRDVVAIAVAQELRIIGYGPKVAFGLVQDHLAPFLRTSVAEQPGDCAGMLWLIDNANGTLGEMNHSQFVRYADNDAFFAALTQSACIVVNVGRVARRVMENLRVQAIEDAAAREAEALEAEAKAEAQWQAQAQAEAQARAKRQAV